MNKELESSITSWREKFAQELRRGVLVLAVLSQLGEAQYGYDLMRILGEQGLQVEQGTLYPLLRRLEEEGLLESEWRIEGARPRRYYRISKRGKEVLELLLADWRALALAMEKLIK